MNRFNEKLELSNDGSYVKYSDYKMLEEKNKILVESIKKIALHDNTPLFIKTLLSEASISARRVSEKFSSTQLELNVESKISSKLNIQQKQTGVIEEGSIVTSVKNSRSVYKVLRIFESLGTKMSEIKTIGYEGKKHDGEIHPNVPLSLLVLYKGDLK